MDLRHRNCPICHSTKQSDIWLKENIDEDKINEFSFASRKIPEYMNFQMICCPDCDVIYTSPAPKANWLINAYTDAGYGSDNEARYAACTYADILKRFLDRIPDKQGALDIGTGNGAFLEELLSLGFSEVKGVEPSTQAIDKANDQVKELIMPGAFDASQFEEASFSLISCFQTIEHLDDPLPFCESAAKLLKKNGVLFLAGHNYRSLLARLMGRRSPIYDIEHLQINSPRSMKTLFEKCRFQDIEVFSYSNRYPMSYWANMTPLPKFVKGLFTSFSFPIPLPAGNQAAIGFKR